MGHKLRELVAYIAVSGLGAEHFHIGGKLAQKLSAGTAGCAPVFAVGVDGYAFKLLMTFADSLAAGSALGTDGTAQGSIFHVAAGEYGAILALDCRAHLKAGIGYVCIERCFFCHGHKFSVSHFYSPSPPPAVILLYIII